MEHNDIANFRRDEVGRDQHLLVEECVAHGGSVDLAKTPEEGEHDQDGANRKDQDLQVVKNTEMRLSFLEGAVTSDAWGVGSEINSDKAGSPFVWIG